MSTSCGWEGKGRYASFRLRMNVWVYTVQVILWNPLRTRVIPECFCMKRRGGAISSVCTFTFRMCLFWTLLELRMTELVVDALPVAVSTASQHRRENKIQSFCIWCYATYSQKNHACGSNENIVHITELVADNKLRDDDANDDEVQCNLTTLPVLLDVLVARPLHLSRAVSSNWNWFHNKATQLPIVYTAGVCCYL